MGGVDGVGRRSVVLGKSGRRAAEQGMTQAVYGRVTDDRLTAAADVFSSAVGQI